MSHGWFALAPFRAAPTGEWLEGALTLDREAACSFKLSLRGSKIVLDAPVSAGARTRALLERAARRVLNLDADLSGFHVVAASQPQFAWIAEQDRGRLLRAPTAWEDLVKLVLTTNCSWVATTGMVRRLVDRYGPRTPEGIAAFPGPAVLAAAGERELREHVRAGYRAPLLAKLAKLVAEGEVDPDGWEGDARRAAELRRELMELPGVGPYVAENFLKMTGRPAGLALDSWLRVQYARVYHGGRRVSDRTIARRYAPFAEWAGLALWCDMVRDWVADGAPPEVAPGPARGAGGSG